mgnify:FL=1
MKQMAAKRNYANYGENRRFFIYSFLVPKLFPEINIGAESLFSYKGENYLIRTHEKHERCILFGESERKLPLAECFVCKRKILRNDLTVDNISNGVGILNFQHLECFPIEEVEREKIAKYER